MRKTVWFSSFQTVEKACFHVGIYQFALHQSLPCVMAQASFSWPTANSPSGRWHGEAVTEGLCSKILRICIELRRKGNILPQQSLSQSVLTAPSDSSLYTLGPQACAASNRAKPGSWRVVKVPKERDLRRRWSRAPARQVRPP